MKKVYETPEMEVVTFETEALMNTSSGVIPDQGIQGDESSPANMI